jgi:hypothetical protein
VAAPLHGTQSLVGQMGWVFSRPSLTATEVLWRWAFGVPFLVVCLMEAHKILFVLPPDQAGLASVDPQNPWVATVQLSNAWTHYQPYLFHSARWLFPLALLAWVVSSSGGRSLVLRRMEPTLRPRITAMMLLQAAWLAGFAAATCVWFMSMQWAAATHITAVGEPDLIGYSMWAIFLSLGFFTLWAFVSWPLTIAPLLMLLEKRSALSALRQSVMLGKVFIGKLIEINLVMGIVNLGLIVLAMVLSAAPLPFSDQLGTEALHFLWIAAAIFYLVASDYFQVVRLKGFIEFCKMYRPL